MNGWLKSTFFKITLWLLPLTFAFACKQSNFSGGGKTREPATANASPTPNPNIAQTPVPVPNGGITKGSFTVRTVPADPRPRQNYEIHIEVKLPSGTSTYAYSDLSGTVKGTDDYFREIGPMAAPKESLFPFWPDDLFKFAGSTATLVMTIPGANVLVQDKIHVRSELLKEEQDIVIVF